MFVLQRSGEALAAFPAAFQIAAAELRIEGKIRGTGRGEIQFGEKTLSGIPVLDLYMNSRITEENADKYLMDGLHPNREGFEQMAKEIAAYLCPGEFE